MPPINSTRNWPEPTTMASIGRPATDWPIGCQVVERGREPSSFERGSGRERRAGSARLLVVGAMLSSVAGTVFSCPNNRARNPDVREQPAPIASMMNKGIKRMIRVVRSEYDDRTEFDCLILILVCVAFRAKLYPIIFCCLPQISQAASRLPFRERLAFSNLRDPNR